MVRLVDPIEYVDKWRELETMSFCSSFFQTKECYDFYSSVSCFTPFAFGVMEDGNLSGVVVGYITVYDNPVAQFFTRRAIIVAGPMLSDSISDNALAFLLGEVVRNLRKRVIYIESRNFFDYGRYKDIFSSAGFAYNAHLNIRIDLASSQIQDIEQRMSKDVLKAVRSGVANGVSIVDSPTMEQVADYYKILSELYRKKIRTPLFPLDFFTVLFALPSARFFLVQHKDKIIGGAVCVEYAGVMYEWFICGEDQIYKKQHPSVFARYSALKYCTENGFLVFDMMGAGKPDEAYGVRDFKARFGGTLVEEGRFIHVCNPLLYSLGKLGVKVLKSI